MAFYVYIIQSEKDSSYYKGFTEDPILRLKQHNNGESKYTESKMPWQLIYLELMTTKKEALIREKALKKHSHDQIQRLIISPKNYLNAFNNLRGQNVALSRYQRKSGRVRVPSSPQKALEKSGAFSCLGVIRDI
jgi:putative endonuclease